MLVTYVGRHDAAELDLPDGSLAVVKHGEHLEVPDELGRSLLEQPANWQRGPKRADKTAAAAGKE